MKIRINNLHLEAAVVVVDDKTATVTADSQVMLDFSHLPKVQRAVALLKVEAILGDCLTGKIHEADLSNVFKSFILKNKEGRELTSECTIPVHVYPTLS